MSMMNPLSFEQTKPFTKMCKDIISLDDKIAFVSILNKNGRLIESECCSDGMIKILSSSELQMLFIQRTLQTSMMKDLDNKLGKFNIAIIHRESFTECVFSFNEGVMLVILKSRTKTNETIKKISKFLEKIETYEAALTC